VAEFPHDLWSLLNWVAPKEYRSFWTFVNNYCQVEEQHANGRSFNKIVGIKPSMDTDGNWSTDITLDVLYRNVNHLVSIHKREDVGVDLPPLTVTDVPLTMTAGQANNYERVNQETIIQLVEEFGTPDTWDLRGGDNSLIIRNAVARFLRLLQVSSAPTVFFKNCENTKREWLLDYLDSGGRPAVIFTRFRHTERVINRTLAERGATGFVVGTYQKLGEGQNFQYLDTLIAWDPAPSRLWWEQARYRIHRLGQERPCQIYRLMASKVDRRAWRQIDYKETTVEMITDWLRREYYDGT
jgi:SNF2 family DNA or RNA helicase